MDLTKLQAEMTADPLSRGYADKADSLIAESLNEPNRPGRKVVPASDVRRFVLLNGIWPRIAALAQNPEDQEVQGVAITILQTLAPNSFDEIRMDDPEVTGAVSYMLGVMVSAGAMTTAQRSSMLAMGDTLVSRAQEIGLPPVHHLDVAAARALNAE